MSTATPHEALTLALRYFAHKDEMNAAVHGGPVRYSPITFRVAEGLNACQATHGLTEEHQDYWILDSVVRAQGAYAEDRGR